MFMCLVCQNRVQSGATLKRMKWKGTTNCAICGFLENSDNIFFSCTLSKFTWACLHEALVGMKTDRIRTDNADTNTNRVKTDRIRTDNTDTSGESKFNPFVRINIISPSWPKR